MPTSRKTSPPDANGQIRDLNAMAGDPDAQVNEAIRSMEKSRHLGIIRAAIGIIEQATDPASRPALHRKYEWYEQQPSQRDGSGYIRAAIVQALQPMVQQDDLPLLQRALVTYQMVGVYEVCAELRAAALVIVNDLDPGFAALFAARFHTDPRKSFSGEPARTSIQMLAAQQNLAPIFGLASWGNAIGEVIGDALRNLVDLPSSLLPILIQHYRESEVEQVLLGLFDLLLEHATRDEWVDEFAHFFRTTTLIDLHGIIALQVVGSWLPVRRVDRVVAESRGNRAGPGEEGTAGSRAGAGLKRIA